MLADEPAFTGMAVLWWLNVWAVRTETDGREGSRWSLWMAPALFLAAGALAKGPFHGLVFYAVVVGALLYERRLRGLISIQHIVSLVVPIAARSGRSVYRFSSDNEQFELIELGPANGKREGPSTQPGGGQER